MVNIYYTRFTQELEKDIWDYYMNFLPGDLQDRNIKFRRWQDRHSNLFGKLLLIHGLKKYGISETSVHKLKYNEYSRPFLISDIDFNISHSGEYVICAISKNSNVGIDIEEFSNIDLNDFNKVMTKDQWDIINRSEDPVKSFFRFWAMKESVIKADRRGLSIPLTHIHIKNSIAHCDNREWYLTELNIDVNYSSFLATNLQNIPVHTEEIGFYN